MEETIATTVIEAPEEPKAPEALAKPKEIFAEAWTLFKRHWKYLVRMCVLGFLFILIAAVPSIALLLLADGIGVLSILGVILFVIPLYVALWWMVAFIRAAARIVEQGTEGTIRQFFDQESRPFIWKMLWMRLLVGLYVLVGIILLIVPGIMFAVWYSFTTYVLVLENTKIQDSLKHSKSYVRGRFWKIFWRWMYVGLIQIAIYIVVAIVVSFLPKGLGETVDFIVRSILNLFWVPFMLLYGYLLYRMAKKTALPA